MINELLPVERYMTPDPVPLPASPFTAIETTDGETADAIVCTSSEEPTISINCRDLGQDPSTLAYRAFVLVFTQTLVGGVSGDTATATPPATTAPITKPLITLVNDEIEFMEWTLSLIPERFFKTNSTFAG